MNTRMSVTKLFSTTLLFSLVCCTTQNKDYDVRFGKAGIAWDKGSPYQTLVEETNVVRRDVGGETGIGILVRPPNDEPYTVYSVHHLPTAPRSIGASEKLEILADGSLRTSPETVKGPSVFSYGFDEGDPLGTYRIDVYINGRLTKSGEIQVVAP